MLSHCQTNGFDKRCDDTVYIGSKVIKTCNNGYSPAPPVEHTCQFNGEWWPPVIKCTAVCGRTPSLPHIPWLVAVLITTDNRIDALPSGVIVSERVILTNAQHKFYQNFENSLVTVVAGAINYHLVSAENRNIQKRTIVERFILPNLLDANDSALGILFTDKPFEFNVNFVAPVCLDLLNSFSAHDNEALVGQIGLVAAFAYNKGGITQNNFKILDNAECKSNYTMNRDFNRANLCARRPDAFGQEHEIISGAGLVVPKLEQGEYVYILNGIGRLGPCDVTNALVVDEEYKHFLNVNLYRDAIRKYVTDYA